MACDSVCVSELRMRVCARTLFYNTLQKSEYAQGVSYIQSSENLSKARHFDVYDNLYVRLFGSETIGLQFTLKHTYNFDQFVST